MTKKHFEAILAKNEIARLIRDEDIGNMEYIKACLQDIEAYIGESNQPSVKEILSSERKDL